MCPHCLLAAVIAFFAALPVVRFFVIRLRAWKQEHRGCACHGTKREV